MECSRTIICMRAPCVTGTDTGLEKRRYYGDTFPHYWSALTGNVFALYAKATKDASYMKRAEDSRRGVLPMIFLDGRASCAYVYPQECE